MDLSNGGGSGGGGDFSSEGNGSVTGREQQELWRNANAFNRYESTLGEYGGGVTRVVMRAGQRAYETESNGVIPPFLALFNWMS